MPGKSRLTFDSPVGTITTIPLPEDQAQQLAAEAAAAGATDVTVTPAAEPDIEDLAEKMAPGLVEEHGRWPYVQDIAVYAEDWLKEHGVHLEIGDFEMLVDELGDIAPGLTLTAS
jgi:hypothetical protein